MDPKQYCSDTLTTLQRADVHPLTPERAQVHVLLAHFSRFAPPDGVAFARELAQIAGEAERHGRSGLAAAAREVLTEWEHRKRTRPGA